jgi:L-lactate utilization protein LutB
VNIEKTIEFIIENQAKSEERFARAEERFKRTEERMDRADRRMDRLERVTTQLVRSGLSLRSDVRQLHKFRVRTEENLVEITEKLNTLIDVVDKSIRRNGGADVH